MQTRSHLLAVQQSAARQALDYFEAGRRLAAHDPDEANEQYLNAWDAARACGRHCHQAGLPMPESLAGTSLEAGFEEGAADVALGEDLHHCPGCRAAAGDPCLIHG